MVTRQWAPFNKANQVKLQLLSPTCSPQSKATMSKTSPSRLSPPFWVVLVDSTSLSMAPFWSSLGLCSKFLSIGRSPKKSKKILVTNLLPSWMQKLKIGSRGNVFIPLMTGFLRWSKEYKMKTPYRLTRRAISYFCFLRSSKLARRTLIFVFPKWKLATNKKLYDFKMRLRVQLKSRTKPMRSSFMSWPKQRKSLKWPEKTEKNYTPCLKAFRVKLSNWLRKIKKLDEYNDINITFS